MNPSSTPYDIEGVLRDLKSPTARSVKAVDGTRGRKKEVMSDKGGTIHLQTK